MPTIDCVAIVLRDRAYQFKDIMITSPYKHYVKVVRHMVLKLAESQTDGYMVVKKIFWRIIQRTSEH